MGDQRAIGVGLLGLGTVGTEVYRLLQDADAIARTVGRPVTIRRVPVARPDRPREVSVPPALLGSDGLETVTSPEIDIVVELIGGIGAAPSYLPPALASGTFVVTATQ